MKYGNHHEMNMKTLLIFCMFFSLSCTQKYTGYDLIRKVDFNKESFERPITTVETIPIGKDKLESCFNQWLFFSNAEKQKNESIPFVIRSLCPGHNFLLNSEMVETWWTTILFTRACVKIETSCAELKK
jgi:hypothetical protein